ncbi:YdeI/OmpD-associated family protein [Spirosoma flavum]|uniref:YdeI/OmpD-associated family protein n=1 Tax=Spirosoma flavum TaxID=2048557 RepID=A0ABW6APV9_9BACT
MSSFTTILQKFGEKGDKTRWTYIEIPIAVTNELKPGQKTSFRVKGTLDNYPIKLVALLPMGRSISRITDGLNGGFMMPINSVMRRGMGKNEEGESIRVSLDVDNDPLPQSADFIACLDDDPDAKRHYDSLAKGHQNYFNNWIEEAKTPETKANRIAKALRGLSMGMGYSEMIRYFKKQS